MMAEAKGELDGNYGSNFFMQVQPNFMRKRRAVVGGSDGGAATSDQQWAQQPGRPAFDLQ